MCNYSLILVKSNKIYFKDSLFFKIIWPDVLTTVVYWEMILNM
jgi:hypothetical protein